MHRVEVDVTRLGGDCRKRGSGHCLRAVFCALGAYLLNQIHQIQRLHRMEDMRIICKRNPYSSDFKNQVDENLKIMAYEATFYQNAGAAADLHLQRWNVLCSIVPTVILFRM